MVTLRRLTTLTAAVSVTVVTALAAVPAASATTAPTLQLKAPKTYYADVPATGKAPARFELELNLAQVPDEKPIAKDVVVTVDAGALAGKVQLKAGGGCTAAGLVFTCDVGSVDGLIPLIPFTIRQAAGATIGEGGTLSYTASSANAGTVTGSTRVVIGGPQLIPRVHPAVKDLAPGARFPLTPAVENTGNLPATGVGVLLYGTDGLRLARKYDNCRYIGADTPQNNAHAVCTFPDVTVAPGTAYEFADALSYGADPQLMYGSIDYLAWALDGPAPAGYDSGSYSVTGTGPALTLKPTAAEGFASTGGSVDVTTGQHADYQALGGVIRGRVGQQVQLRLGVRNNGPGSMQLGDRAGSGSGTMVVEVPAGVTVLSIPFPGEDDPWACTPRAKAARTYSCEIDDTFYAGDDFDLTFVVRIDKAVKGARGSVTAKGRADYPNRDDVPGNDTAALTVQVPGASTPPATPSAPATPGATTGGSATGSGGATGAAASGGSSGGSSSGGSSSGGATGATSSGASAGATGGTSGGTSGGGALAATGTDDRTGLITGSAVLALGLGVGALAIVRRRRSAR
ncbi:hypothetical protein ACIQGZ_26400 [Streptomyces sp. NPDC092296]|uniref:hypothetical protein n=1 Tax=Streptomyces sp. NPDC092296 TaxID=3366012 RepID=UPI0037FF63A8